MEIPRPPNLRPDGLGLYYPKGLAKLQSTKGGHRARETCFPLLSFPPLPITDEKWGSSSKRNLTEVGPYEVNPFSAYGRLFVNDATSLLLEVTRYWDHMECLSMNFLKEVLDLTAPDRRTSPKGMFVQMRIRIADAIRTKKQLNKLVAKMVSCPGDSGKSL